MRRTVSLLLLFACLGVVAAGCGRKDIPDYPQDASERPANLPRRGTPVPYN
ncbi:MAG: hypothetical protein KA106_05280 [Ferrovibrio sp.]|jgi:predicted small lipoprotein YifL|nr:hypothetical protein [Ferrovibrio sp.]